MGRVPWRRVRIGSEHERADRQFNEELAERLLSDPAADDFCVAVDLCGWQLTPQSPQLAGEKWPLVGSAPLCPDWAMSVAEQERDIRKSIAIAAGMHEFAQDG